MSFTLFAYILILIGIGYILTRLEKSYLSKYIIIWHNFLYLKKNSTPAKCGAFNDPSNQNYETTYDYINKIIDDLKSINQLQLLIRFLLAPGLLAFAIFIARYFNGDFEIIFINPSVNYIYILTTLLKVFYYIAHL